MRSHSLSYKLERLPTNDNRKGFVKTQNRIHARMTALLAVALLAATPATAQDTPTAEISGTFSLTSGLLGADCKGGGGSLAWNLNSWLGAVGELNGCRTRITSGLLGPVEPNTNTTLSYLFGPRVSYRSQRRFTPFAHALFGGAHGTTTFSPGSHEGNTFSMSAGIGLDLQLTQIIALRLVQPEYFMTRFGGYRQNEFRFQTGIVLRLGTVD